MNKRNTACAIWGPECSKAEGTAHTGLLVLSPGDEIPHPCSPVHVQPLEAYLALKTLRDNSTETDPPGAQADHRGSKRLRHLLRIE